MLCVFSITELSECFHLDEGASLASHVHRESQIMRGCKVMGAHSQVAALTVYPV